MGLPEAIFLPIAAFVAGAINAVAGGGTLLTFPSLLAAGYSAKAANVTNTVAIWPGTAGGSFAYRRELAEQRGNIVALIGPTLVGSVIGSAILLSTPSSAFDVIVPFLILFACLVLALQDRLAAVALAHPLLAPAGARLLALQAGMTLVAVYGAYFGAGIGIMMLALLGVLLPDDIQRSNALKGLLAMLINGLAAVYFALFGPVAWPAAAVMAVGALLGGFFGVRLARRLGRQRLRMFVITYGVISAIVLLVRLVA